MGIKLDQFYTKPEVAQHCWSALQGVLGDTAEMFFLEPSAGTGVFYALLPPERRSGMDLDPRHPDLLRQDFLTIHFTPPTERSRAVVVGNPPFGKRGKLAVQFVNRALDLADTVAFIVPVIFRKHFIHKQIAPDAAWVHSTDLPLNAFRTAAKTDYPVNTEFQIWSRLPLGRANRRLFSPPPISHPDFVMWQYNNTKQALKHFKNDFDFAVPCQGWQDYSRREKRAADCEKHKQWMLFSDMKPQVRKRLYADIDFDELAHKFTTSTPGFRKGDLVQQYCEQYGLAPVEELL